MTGPVGSPVGSALRPGRAPTVSVITIFLNAGRFIAEAIDSVFAQQYDDWELVLVDDGSTDDSTAVTRRYAARFPGRVRYVDHPGHANRGMSVSRNAGLRVARGRLVAFLDADDVWLPGKLAEQVGILVEHADIGLVYGASRYWHGWTGAADDMAQDHVPALGVVAERVYPPPQLALRLYPLGTATPPPPSDWMVRRSVIDSVGGFEEAFGGANQLYEDQAFLAKVFLRAGAFVSSATWTHYRIHPDSCSSQSARQGRYRAVRGFYLRWLHDYVLSTRLDSPPILDAIHQAQTSLDSRWSLRAANGNQARLRISGDDHQVRVDIDQVASAAAYDVQLNLSGLRLAAGVPYRLSFRARSDRARRVLLGIAEAHEPWAGLGWYHAVEFDTDWRSFSAEFVPARDEASARIHFDLGASSASIEVAAVELQRLPDGEPVDPAD